MSQNIKLDYEIEHSTMVSVLAKPGIEVLKDLTPASAHAIHMAVGISGEAGELLDAIKKHAIYKKPADYENIIEELGDLEFYMEGLRQGFGITREETLRHNLVKLNTRYSKGSFSNQ